MRTTALPVKTVLITGVAGFIGSNLAVALLQHGYHVIGIDNLAYGDPDNVPAGVRFLKADIRDPRLRTEFKDVDVVFHLAAKNCISDCQADPLETADININGSINVFEAARCCSVRKVVYAESSSLYEGSTRFPTPETECAPLSFYAISKFGSRSFAEAYQRFYSIRFTALRYFGVYGPRQDHRRSMPPVHSAFIMKLLSGERPTIYGDGRKKRDFVYVDDVNDFHLRCIEDRRTDGCTFNLGSGITTSINELYLFISRLIGSKIEPLYSADLQAEAQTTHADIAAATALGWRPRVSLEEGLSRQITYIREHVMGRTAAAAEVEL